MSLQTSLYPPSPEGVPNSITEPSATYRSQVKSMVWSIASFIIVYVLLVLAAIALAVGCGFLDVLIISF